MPIVISVENLSKTYRLGQIGTGTFSNDLNVWWAKLRGKPNPLLRIGETDHGNRDGEELWALRDVSFKVEQGEVLGIIGRNGAGKSTLLKILSRVTAPTSGKIKVKGRVASLLEVGTGFHPELTGRENIYLNGAILGMDRKEIERKFDEIVAFAEVEKFIDTPVKRYSSGMYVRLAFAVAAHLEPEILVVDEVLAVGDAAFQKKCLGKMGDIAKEGRTVLFVSHNMSAILALCNYAILLSGGRIAANEQTQSAIKLYYSESSASGSEYVSSDTDFSKPKIIKARLLDKNQHLLTHLIPGESLTLVVEFKSNTPLPSPNLGVRFNNELGTTTFGVNTLMQNKDVLCKSSKHGRIIVQFPELPLNQGTYYVSLVLGDSAIDVQKLNDVIKFTVDPADIYGTGKIPSIHQSLILSKGVWKFEELPDGI